MGLFNKGEKVEHENNIASRKCAECNKVNAMPNSYFCSDCAEDFYRE